MEWTLMVLSKFLFFHFLGNQTKTEKELRNDFAWVWGWGLWNLWFFFYGVFMLNFLGLWIWFLGLWILFAGGFVVDWMMRKFGFELWFCISGFWGLRKSEKICYWVCVCVLARDWFVFVFGWQERARKCKKIWTCVLMFKIWVCVLWCSCWRWT